MVIAAEEYRYQDGAALCIGRLALPGGAETRPGIAVFADMSGVAEQTIERSIRLARDNGYVALAADIYGDGMTISDVGEGVARVQACLADPEALVQRAGAALDALKRHPRCNGQLGAIGFCFGGAVVLELARAARPDLLGGVSFHGNLTTARPRPVDRISARLLVCHGAEDPYVPKTDLVAFLDEMAASGADCQTIAYTGAVHSFTNPKSDLLQLPGVAYHAPTDRRSWQAMERFFEEVFA